MYQAKYLKCKKQTTLDQNVLNQIFSVKPKIQSPPNQSRKGFQKLMLINAIFKYKPLNFQKELFFNDYFAKIIWEGC